MFRKMLSGLVIAAIVTVGTPLNAQEVVKDGSVTFAIDSLASTVQTFCSSGKITVGLLKISPFRIPAKFNNDNAGKTLAVKLSGDLSKRGVQIAKVLDRPTHELQGTCLVEIADDIVVLKLILILTEAEQGKEVVGFRETVSAVEVSDREEIIKDLGLTVDVTPKKLQTTGVKAIEQIASIQEAKLTDSVKNPAVTITTAQAPNPTVTQTTNPTVQTTTPTVQTTPPPPQGGAAGTRQTIISPSATSKFKIEILAGLPEDKVARKPASEFVPVAVSNVSGQAIVGLNPNERYAIRIYNDFEFDVAVKITLDGINSFALSDVPEYKRLGCWIIPRKSSATVRGWHRNDRELLDFLVTDYPGSVAKLLGGPAEGIGVIQAQFFPAWMTDEPQPFEALAARGDLGTGAGQISQSQSERLTRLISPSTLGAVTVRYSRPELPTDLPAK